MNAEELLDRAKAGTITRPEVDSVGAALESGTNGDPYVLLQILGRAQALDYRGVVEKYLNAADDPMMARLALQIVCNYWGETSKYRDTVRRFLSGVPWDADDDVRLVAASAAGEYLRDKTDADLLRQLRQLYEDETVRQAVREAAYCALARAMGRKWDDIPPASRHFDLDKDIDSSVLTEVAERVRRSEE